MKATPLSRWYGMKRNKFRRITSDQLISSAEDEYADDDLQDDTLSKASAEYYERSWNNRIKGRQLDSWIAVSLYLLLSSIAFVVL